jgi:hypothetical protein
VHPTDTSRAPAASPTFTGTVTEPDGTTNTTSGYTFAHALTLPSGSVATTQAAGDNSTKVATDQFVASEVAPNSTAVPWLTVGHVANTNGAPFAGSANKASFYGIILNAPKTTSALHYFVGTTADNTSNTYDFGIYTGTSGGTCTLVAHTGSTAGTTNQTCPTDSYTTSMAPTASTWYTINWAGGAVTLAPGRYYLAVTSSATSGTFTTAVDSAELTFAGSVGNVALANGATGGNLGTPGTTNQTCPTDSYTTSSTFPAWAVN